MSANLRPRAQIGSTEPFSTSRDSHDFHELSNTQEDHNGGDNQDDDDDEDDDEDDDDVDGDDDVSSDFFAGNP